MIPKNASNPDAADQIREVLIHGNYLSQKDIDICLHSDFGLLADTPGQESIRELHEVLRVKYGSDDESTPKERKPC